MVGMPINEVMVDNFLLGLKVLILIRYLGVKRKFGVKINTVVFIIEMTMSNIFLGSHLWISHLLTYKDEKFTHYFLHIILGV